MALSHTFILLIVYFLTFANSNIDKDKEECADTLVGIATCLPYVSGDAKAPTLDCCSGLRNVLKTSKKCLCVLVKDRNDPGLGLKINATLALSLPTTCHSPANISECPYSGGNNDLWPAALLHLAPNSPDSKVFEDFAKNNESSNANDTHAKETPNTTSTTGSSAKLTNEGGTGKSWLGVEMVSFITTSTMVYLLLKI